MKDIDFDELDRAVSSLMSGVPKAEPENDESAQMPSSPQNVPAENEPEQTAPAQPASRPESSDNASDSDERPAPAPRTFPSASPPAARRGRFMDMVRAEAKKPVPSRPVSRQGVTINPSNPSSPARPSVPFAESTTLSPRPEVMRPGVSANGDQPDPLEAIGFDATTEAITVNALRAETVSLQKSAQTTGVMPADGSALPVSPFLPDAKVEKRPLGRPSDESAPAPDFTQAPVVLADDAEPREEPSGDTASPEQPLPAELSRDVMAVEAGVSDMVTETPEPLETKAPPVQPAAAVPAPGAIRPQATSIPQQYKVQPKAAEPSTGAIYDTAAYHQPLSHPQKKKPGWLWVVAIILILLLGAASGAAVYYLGLV